MARDLIVVDTETTGLSPTSHVLEDARAWGQAFKALRNL